MNTITVEAVKARINSLGFVTVPQDDVFLQFQINKTVKYALAQINYSYLPDGLYEIVLDMVVGEFLLIYQATGRLEDGSGNTGGGSIVSGTVSQITDGDTTVRYATNAETGKGSGNIPTGFQGLLDQLLNPDYDWGQWRKLRWC